MSTYVDIFSIFLNYLHLSHKFNPYVNSEILNKRSFLQLFQHMVRLKIIKTKKLYLALSLKKEDKLNYYGVKIMKKFFLLFTVLIFSGFICLAQDDSDSVDIDIDDCEDVHDWEWSFEDFDGFEFNGRPTIETPYGVANVGLKSIDKNFMNVGIAELRLGYAKLKNYKSGNVVKYNNHYLLLSNLSSELNSKSKNLQDLNPEMWRFGFGSISGYGYSFGNSAIIPYTSGSFMWTRLNVKDFSAFRMDSTDRKTLELFNESFRFGTITEGGLRVQLAPIISLNAGYERTVVFPRVLVWKFLGSAVIEGIAGGAIDAFVKEIMHNSPAAGPIVNFVLKNALSFGMYQLRHEKMNWPFKSAEPLYTDTWKVGLTFTF